MQIFKFLAPLAGLAAVAVAADANSTTTIVVNEFVTYCPEPTVFIFKEKAYTVTAATTLTITGKLFENRHTRSREFFSVQDAAADLLQTVLALLSATLPLPSNPPRTTPFPTQTKRPMYPLLLSLSHLVPQRACRALRLLSFQ